MSDVLKLEHGGGGSLMRKLIEETIIPRFSLNRLEAGIGLPNLDDGASIPLDSQNIVVTTDATTVKPLFFPGGDIGRLAVSGAINDLSMMGARPLAITSALIAEEGLPIELLTRILESMNETLEEVGVPIIAGDTKVVERGGLDEILVCTSGVGVAESVIVDSGLGVGDKILVSGTIGNHQLSILSKREGIEFDSSLVSDVAPLWDMISRALDIGGIKAMKDPTRGGLSGALNDMAKKSDVDIAIREEDIPIKGVVSSASEMLGLDPMELANEGIAVIGVESSNAEEVLEVVKENRYGRDAAIIGEVLMGSGKVIMETFIGGRRIVREPFGSPMSRIC